MTTESKAKTTNSQPESPDNNPDPVPAPLHRHVIPAHNEGQGHRLRHCRDIREAQQFSRTWWWMTHSTDDTIAKARQAGAVVVPLALQLGGLGRNPDRSCATR